MNEHSYPARLGSSGDARRADESPRPGSGASPAARRFRAAIPGARRALVPALITLIALTMTGGSPAPIVAAASAGERAPLLPALSTLPAKYDAGPAAETHPAHGEDIATKRGEILSFVAATFNQGNSAGILTAEGVIPRDEALQLLHALSDEDVERMHDAVPIIHNWPIIQRGMASGAVGSELHRQPLVRGQRTFSPSQTAELEQFRSDLDEVFVIQQSWEPLVGAGDPGYRDRIEDGRRLVQDATLEDLAGLQEAITWIPDWQGTLAPDLVGLLGPGGIGTLLPPESDPRGRLDGAQPQVTTEQCSDADRSRDVLPLVIASGVVKGVSLIAGFAANFFTKDIKICFAVIFVTVCIDFPNPIFFILKLIELASNRVVDGLNAAILVAGVCTSIDHWNLTVQHRNNFLLNAQAILASLIARHNELITRTERIDFANREAWKLELQLAIEENLLAPAPDPSGVDENRISLFQLTDTVCFNPDELLPTPVPALPTPSLVTPSSSNAPPPSLSALPTPKAPTHLTDRREQCGITLVKRIVDEAIQLNKLAANNVHDADAHFAAANVHFNAGRYKEAYLRYRQAYMAAVQPDDEPRRLVNDSANR